MSLIIATGSNLNDKLNNLNIALIELQKFLTLTAKSRIYTSSAVDYLNQPDFYNQVLEFKIPENYTPIELMDHLLAIEEKMGRDRSKSSISKGPRPIDLDVLFIGTKKLSDPKITLPHPRLFERSFVVEPLKELPYFEVLKTQFNFPSKFDNYATPI